ncbi:recombinase family protein [Citreimonas sp.]|uniref:recombinase family protein n=1 Tax=Citreimonas sp. TaxID=3036715 RepID=UPI0035C7A3C3
MIEFSRDHLVGLLAPLAIVDVEGGDEPPVAPGDGILNNELHVGRLVWNRLRYVKDPQTGKRVSRQNPPESWIATQVPDPRIVDDALWQRVKTRQEAIDATPAVQGIKASRF